MKSLRLQLILLVFLPLTVLGTVVVWMTHHAVEGLLEHRLQKEIELVARAMRVPVERSLLAGDLGGVQDTLDAVFDIGRVYGAYVYDAGGRRVAVAGEARPGPREQIEAAELVALGEELGRYAELGGEEVFSYFVPLTGPAGRIEGLLQVVRLEQEIAEQLEELRVLGWLLWTLVMVVMFAIVLIGHRLAVGRHVERLVQSMARVEAGEPRHRAQVDGPDELAGVAGALNRMLDGLDRMQAELDVERQERQYMLEQMRQQEHLAALGRFSSGVAHELGAPLTVIDGDTRRLQQHEDLGDDARRRLERMRRQVQRTRELISQLMEFVRSDHQPAESVELGRLLRRTLAAMRPECESRGIELSVDELPDEIRVRGWEVRLEHALVNLVRNAVQAASSAVAVVVERRNGSVVVAVEDDGPGVPAGERERIFEPFHTRGKEGRGTGLGLAIVKSVAEEHQAGLNVVSSHALGGSRFELVLDQEAADG
ncbi:HAMP domain-containing histidine kinase [Wenzhouxiangella sp. AB-CW3]|uniref:sensor histidine kinase n=1 Tax=Wenzhouxiangella sp. AB-CW3 TaxID=2771012 RepID=UPI00168A61E1|nr:ATP-binding protein [Wenzhouxiangella sp. AB-CW3]QOC23968.1 HAMP domain-containing histidine kinase [Wenzhouxiangella sp. AB-CW3]